MRIIHLINYFQSKLGYQEFYLAKYQQKFGHKVLVVTSDRYYPFPDYEQNYYNLLGDRFVGVGRKREEEIEIARLPILLEYKKSSQVILRGVLSVFREFKPDIVHCHTLLSPISLQAVLGKRRFGYKLIFDSHVADFNTSINRTYLARLYKLFFLKTIIIPQIKKHSNGIFAVAEPERDFLCKNFGFARNKIEIINLGVDTELFSTKNKKQQEREKLGLKKNDIILMFSGRITPSKGVDLLINAVARLNNPSVKILSIGGSPSGYLDKLKKMAVRLHVNVVWKDFVVRQQLAHYYKVADVAVWPKNPSISMLEAMASGLPLVTPFWQGSNYLKVSGGVVYFESNNIDSLTKELDNLIKNEKLRIKIGNNAQKYIKNQLSWETITKKVLDFYQTA